MSVKSCRAFVEAFLFIIDYKLTLRAPGPITSCFESMIQSYYPLGHLVTA